MIKYVVYGIKCFSLESTILFKIELINLQYIFSHIRYNQRENGLKMQLYSCKMSYVNAYIISC